MAIHREFRRDLSGTPELSGFTTLMWSVVFQNGVETSPQIGRHAIIYASFDIVVNQYNNTSIPALNKQHC